MTDGERFYDAESGGPLRLELRRVGSGSFRVARAFGYRDPDHENPFVVPSDPATFTTDLMSVPWPFAWLIPGQGEHLPAVLLHDGLVVGAGQPPTHLGPDIDREEADRIFRDAMGHLGTGRVRRWLVWTAVVVATAFATLKPRWWWRSLVVATFGGVAALGVIATLDLFDVVNWLPWMGDRAWWVEVGLGGAMAVVIPLLISVLWVRLWPAAAIGGTSLALLLHTTIAVVLTYGIYWIAERIVSGRGAP